MPISFSSATIEDSDSEKMAISFSSATVEEVTAKNANIIDKVCETVFSWP